MSATGCGRCGSAVALGTDESCWYCHATLCRACWDLVGHCGHAEADHLNALARRHDPTLQQVRLPHLN